MANKKQTLDVLTECPKCGATLKAKGHVVKHRTGTMSFVVYNVNADCIYCHPRFKEIREQMKIEGFKFQ